MSEKEPPQKGTASNEQERLKELCDMVREDIEAQRDIVRKLRRKLH